MTTLYGLLLGMLLAALDQNIVTTAVPAIAADLGGFEHLSWIFAGYLLTSTASTPIYGKVSDLYGRGPLLIISIVLFVLSSAFCALSQDMVQLVAARALQGLGGGGMMSVTQALIADIISPRERGRYQAYFASVWAAASVAGPMLGGFFVQYLSWRWTFWINLPIGALAVILCTRAFRKLPRPRLARRDIDYWGAALLTGFGDGAAAGQHLGRLDFSVAVDRGAEHARGRPGVDGAVPASGIARARSDPADAPVPQLDLQSRQCRQLHRSRSRCSAASC